MLNKEKLEVLKKFARENHVPILQDDTMQVIKTILAIRKPNKILEIGTAIGYSALCFSEYLEGENAIIKSVELDKVTSEMAKNNIKEISDENNIMVTNMDAYEYMKTLNEKFDVVFIDAAKGQYMKYLEQAYRLTQKGSIIIAEMQHLSDFSKRKNSDTTRNGNDASYFHRKLGTLGSCSSMSFFAILFLQSESKLF